jgi:hypothetical protein
MIILPVHEADTKELIELEEDTWLVPWINQGYELDSSIAPGTKRFVFSSLKEKDRLLKEPESIFGCVEFIPYDENSSINETFPFNNYDFLKGKKVVEIDKLAIKEDHQGSLRSLIELISFTTFFPIEQGYDYAVVFLNPNLYEKIISRFQIPLIKLFSNTDLERNYIPVIIDVPKVVESKFGKNAIKRFKAKELSLT